MVRLLALVMCLMTGAAATAQTLPDWFSSSGRLVLGYSDRVAGADAFLVGDATLRFAPVALAQFGAELGFYGRADALDTPHETYGALTWDFGQHRLAVGVPRPAYDGFAVSALEYSFPSLGIDRTAATRSAATNGAMFLGWLPYGASLTGQTEGFHYAVSVHDASNVGMTVASVGASRNIGDWQVSGAVEVSWGTSTEVSGKLQVQGQIGMVTGGLGYYSPGAVGGSDMVEAFARVRPIDRMMISAVVQVSTDGAADPTAGIAARYGFNESGAVSVGVASDAGSDAVFNAILDWKF